MKIQENIHELLGLPHGPVWPLDVFGIYFRTCHDGGHLVLRAPRALGMLKTVISRYSWSQLRKIDCSYAVATGIVFSIRFAWILQCHMKIVQQIRYKQVISVISHDIPLADFHYYYILLRQHYLFVQSLVEFGFQAIPTHFWPFGSKMRLLQACEPPFDFGPSLTLAFLLPSHVSNRSGLHCARSLQCNQGLASTADQFVCAFAKLLSLLN